MVKNTTAAMTVDAIVLTPVKVSTAFPMGSNSVNQCKYQLRKKKKRPVMS